ncbi:hypothetical protein A2765_05505 [Candidatus Kaiserbacteria bacterium RIFCSPHIGHO2_01_FULL_56_24]|uniref:LamG-like jellyroll fold domain-containing protein n=1 Tax=Candidatus Kaiserbacteria bacterium RIFCSPHIGHO2_01_FULL_56_24 TaxID=1798487 RepID=A0A1F6DAE6_9BACT|nr:MAG: hypothetical protein A2765_05505 [Candidatus Kaiserbacteria bacterium RIFCSPHIGHO2_01_FULL_56_24]
MGGAGAAGKQGIIAITYTPPSGSIPAWTNGKRGKALDFDGSGSYISVGNAGSGIKTIAFWMKADDTTSRKIINIDGTDQIELNSSSEVVATSFPAATVYVDASTASAVVDTGWHFVVITDSTGVSASTFEIGRVASSYFDGKIDEVRTYTRALSAAEIAKLYQSGAVKFTTSSVALQQGSSLGSGLVGHWTFDGPDVTTVVADRSGQGNNGYFVGGATSSAKTIGHLGQALSFDGTSYIDIGSPASLAVSQFTICAWIKPSVLSSYHLIYGLANAPKFYLQDSALLLSGGTNPFTASIISADVWQHVCASNDASNTRFYLNGALNQTSADATTWSTSASQVKIAQDPSGSTQNFSGSIDDVRIYNRALTASEVKQLYNLGKATIRQ